MIGTSGFVPGDRGPELNIREQDLSADRYPFSSGKATIGSLSTNASSTARSPMLELAGRVGMVADRGDSRILFPQTNPLPPLPVWLRGLRGPILPGGTTRTTKEPHWNRSRRAVGADGSEGVS